MSYDLAHALQNRSPSHASDDNEFAVEFRKSAQLDAVLFGFFNAAKEVFSECWVSRAETCPPDTCGELKRAAALQVAKVASNNTPNGKVVVNGAGQALHFHQCFRTGRREVWIGKPVAGLFPVMACEAGEEISLDQQRALLRVGVAYVSRMLTKHVYALPVWPDGLVEATLKLLSIGFFVVAEDGEIRYDGDSSRTGVEEGSWLVRHNRLALRSESERITLRKAILEAASEPRQASIISMTVAPGIMRLAAVAPMGPPAAALALVLFESQNTDHLALREHFFRAYELTRSESSVAHEVLNGKDLFETAKATNLSLSTVRSYMKQILAKTGTHRQSELIALYYNSILPVGKSIAKAGVRSAT